MDTDSIALSRGRFQDWPQRLSQFVREGKARQFEWGSSDCVTFAADWIEVCTGQRVFEAQHTDAASAARFTAAQGGFREAVSAVLGEPIEFPKGAHRGDIALVQLEGRESLGVVLGERVVGLGAGGLGMVPRDEIVLAWRV